MEYSELNLETITEAIKGIDIKSLIINRLPQ